MAEQLPGTKDLLECFYANASEEQKKRVDHKIRLAVVDEVMNDEELHIKLMDNAQRLWINLFKKIARD